MNIVGDSVALGPLRGELLPLYERWINDFGTIRRFWDEIFMDCLATDFESPVLGRVLAPDEPQ